MVFRHTWLMLPGTFRDDLAFCLNGGGKSWKIPIEIGMIVWGYPYDSGNLQMLSYSLPESNHHNPGENSVDDLLTSLSILLSVPPILFTEIVGGGFDTLFAVPSILGYLWYH